MTVTVGVLLAVAGAVAVVDWWAVSSDDRQRVEFVAKPLTLALLVVAAIALDPVDATAQKWFVVALVFSLAGDVFLMLPSERFIGGLASFLVGHLAYIVGLRYLGMSTVGLVIASVLVIAAIPIVGARIIRAVRAGDEPELAVPVGVYMAVISVMVVAAGASGVAIALVGAVLFYASDALIAWTRFIEPKEWGRVGIMVTYHLAQFGLVLALV